MDIAAASMAMSSATVVQQASISMAKNAMDMQEQQATSLIQMMQTAAPSFGHTLDIRA